MVKKLLLLLMTIIVLTSATFAVAEELDLSQLTFDELIELRTKITLEMQSRPEAEDIVLGVGEYVVGRDLNPGSYYLIYESGNMAPGYVSVYSDETKSTRILRMETETSTYDVYTLSSLVEGNVVVVEHNGLRANQVGFPEYFAPKGTVIPAGTYEIGVDIPAGRYTAHLLDGLSYIYIYPDSESCSQKDWQNRESFLLAHGNRECLLSLQEGSYVVIERNSLIMNKYVPGFTFE
ncbi:MAG: hypothetical protein IKK75_01845 [Clostridia bacterium]|nr:hypothetical protein [Clostridia bacterium]